MTSIIVDLPRAQVINANHRLHHFARASRTKVLRELTAWAAHKTGPVSGKVHILATYYYPDKRWPRDEANLFPTTKACVDGLVDAGVLAEDDHHHVIGPDTRICREIAPMLTRDRVRLILRLEEERDH